MKSIVLVVIKLTLTALFLFNIGLISLFRNLKPSVQPPDKGAAWVKDMNFLNEKIKRAEALGRKYTPELYFSDLTDIRLKEKNNDFDRRVLVNRSVDLLFNCFNNNLVNTRMHSTNAEYCSLMNRLSAARGKHEEILDPGCGARRAKSEAEMKVPGYWRGVLLSILVFLGKFYLKNFLLAFVLLWTWWYREKEKIAINNPTSFLICLLLYPITIVRVWCKTGERGARELAMSIMFKRRDTDIFSMISDDELADIKRFAKSNLKISDYRAYLNNRGLVCQHSLVPVIMVTLLFLAVPKTFSSGNTSQSNDTVKYHLEIKAPPGFSGEHFSLHHQDKQVVASAAIIFPDQFIFQIMSIWKPVTLLVFERRPGFKTNPDPVPLTY